MSREAWVAGVFLPLGLLAVWFLAFGLILPLASVALGMFIEAAAPLAFACAGLSAFAAGWALKFILVTRAGYNQGFALSHIRYAALALPGRWLNRDGFCHDTPPRRSNHVDASCSPR